MCVDHQLEVCVSLCNAYRSVVCVYVDNQGGVCLCRIVACVCVDHKGGESM